MENKLFEELDNLNIKNTTLLLDEDINLSIDYLTRKRIEKSIKKKIGHYEKSNIRIEKINDILGEIFMKRKIALALSVGVVLSLGGGVYAHAKTTPVAYVSVDINPSVELGVNAFDEVVSTEAYNEDGKKVLEGTNLVNSDVDDAVSTVISNAISDGYITQDATTTSAVAVEITTSTDKENVATELNESLKEVADKTLDNNNVDAEVETEKVALARRDEARKLGITPGKLNLIQKLQELDPTITVEDYKDSSVKDIQKKAKELRKDNKSNAVTTEENTNTTDTSTDVTADENINTSSNNNGNSKKEEHSNSNSIKEESNSSNDKEKDTITIPSKQNNSNNLNSQNNNSNNSNPEKNNNSKSQNNSSNKEKNKND
ncbi:MAG: hypothetical protein LLF98_08240 [Clostridium sp.]|uniref:anti-sigma-I factor RsgI family protein n=1 Tax=Clostridium sp. TaxID=1506 RepID=UPI0025BADF60|nr:hypothetical protein [Clostridium sp.]MCE5221244.1 hypothetical protein [Clostridium sp.]